MADEGDSGAYDRAVELSIKLNALLLHAYGEGAGEAFRNMRGDIQDAYLWACSDMASEIHELMPKLA